MNKIIATVLLFSLLISQSWAASISAQLDVSPVLLSDSFHLTYTASGSVDADPNLNPIKKHFEILGNQQSSNIQMINGSFTQSKTWTLTLLAKKAGTFTIPSIYFGADRAPEVKVMVKKQVMTNGFAPSQDFIVELETSRKSGYMQQQFIITTRLLVAKNITGYQFSNLTTSNPDTLITPLGKETQHKTYIGNKQFIVIEKKFALFSQEKEILTINPLVAEISIANRSSNSRFFDPFNTNSVTKRLYSKALKLTIKDVPKSYTAENWLPSTAINLSEKWPKNTIFTAGEPITRTITLHAEKVSSSNLAKIILSTTKNIKQYPDKPIIKQNITESGVTARLTQKIAYIPSQPGKYTLPSITIPWWNTKTNKMATAKIAAKTFTVVASSQNNLILPQKNTPLTDLDNLTESSETKVTDNVEKESSFWFWLCLCLLIIWLVTLYFFWKLKSSLSKRSEDEVVSTSITKQLRAIKKYCQNNDAKETHVALLSWAKLVFPTEKINNLSDIANNVDEPLAKIIFALNSHLYSSVGDEWTCDNLYDLCKKYKVTNSINVKKSNSAALEEFK